MAARNRLRIEPGYSFAVLVLAALSPVSRRLPAHGVAPSQFGGPNGALRWLGMRFRPQNASTGRSATLRSAERNSAAREPSASTFH
jgi:hypothetical protein